ncbi:EVE domain-containing protein [Chryseobacterium sp. JUb7]|uniref:EVE domain-containing protein n=1 Tax=Chryseobacterium sp. JUb7 TaxID=2940599 RepID=UPI00216785DB|nr:EVE domain-containing protein [Chryseobacterium sp. JUb7]MCS3532684.1 putative RNA-binding protein [Chryseobacterium sp. JUb7]
MKYYIAVASKDHVERGVQGGFMQANHGKATSLKRLKTGDKIIFYSPKRYFEKEEKCQCFTAIGEVKDEELYPGIMAEGFQPFRRNVKFYDAEEISIFPLIEQLDFITDKKKWGFSFRFGFLEISEKDFDIIKNKML